MNQAELLTSHHALEEILVTLRAHAILPSSLRLIGLLGVGNNATVFAVTIDDIHHILKAYSSRERMARELRHLRKITSSKRRIISWEDDIEGFHFCFFIVEMEHGHPLHSRDVNLPRQKTLVSEIVGLHRVRYRQVVSVAGLRRRWRLAAPGLSQLGSLGLDEQLYLRLYTSLGVLLKENQAVFAVPKSRIHGDLWWPNIVATATEAYLIDWDEMRRADAAEDLAKLRIDLWFSQNAFPSRNFFWSAPSHGGRVGQLMKIMTSDHEKEFNDNLTLRLKFYLPLYGFEQLAKLAAGRSIVEPLLRRPLYNLLAQDFLRLSVNPVGSPPSLLGSEYYALVKLSRTVRLDSLPMAVGEPY
jgi:hypothetical protein